MADQTFPSHLTVAMIVRNAENLLTATVESIRHIADQVVVYDTGSTDATASVAMGLGVQLVEGDWTDDFSAARNACLQYATSGWVLWLDAGETMTLEDALRLKKFLLDQPPRNQAFLMCVVDEEMGSGNSPEQIARIRLHPNNESIRFSGRIRETLEPSLTAAGIELSGVPCRIHRSASHQVPAVKSRIAGRNIQLVDLEIRQRGPQPSLLNCLGEAFQVLGDNERAARYYQQALETSAAASLDMLEAFYGLLTTVNEDQQIPVCLQALDVFPLDSQLLCAMGSYLQAQGQLELAARSYETAFRFGQVDPMTWHVVEVQEIAATCLNLTFQLQGNFDVARDILIEAIEHYPDSRRLHRHLLELYVKCGERPSALGVIDRMPGGVENREAMRSSVRGACLASQQNWIAARAYLETGYRAGCRDPLCQRWYVTTLLATGRVEPAQKVTAEWYQRDPKCSELQQFRALLPDVTNAQDEAPPQTPATTSAGRMRIDGAAAPEPNISESTSTPQRAGIRH